MNKEIWDSYHRDGTPAGGDLVRGHRIPNGLYHMICTVAVTNTDGSVLLVQRDRRKSFGGMWEASAGGSALKGESPEQCAMRELREETGIDGTGMRSEGFYPDDKFRSIIYEFSLSTDIPKDSVKLQAGETQDYRWVPREEFAEMMRSRSRWNISPRSRHFGYRIIREAEEKGLIPKREGRRPKKKAPGASAGPGAEKPARPRSDNRERKQNASKDRTDSPRPVRPPAKGTGRRKSGRRGDQETKGGNQTGTPRRPQDRRPREGSAPKGPKGNAPKAQPSGRPRTGAPVQGAPRGGRGRRRHGQRSGEKRSGGGGDGQRRHRRGADRSQDHIPHPGRGHGEDSEPQERSEIQRV